MIISYNFSIYSINFMMKSALSVTKTSQRKSSYDLLTNKMPIVHNPI